MSGLLARKIPVTIENYFSDKSKKLKGLGAMCMKKYKIASLLKTGNVLLFKEIQPLRSKYNFDRYTE